MNDAIPCFLNLLEDSSSQRLQKCSFKIAAQFAVLCQVTLSGDKSFSLQEWQ
jgi:hypothetical protein